MRLKVIETHLWALPIFQGCVLSTFVLLPDVSHRCGVQSILGDCEKYSGKHIWSTEVKSVVLPPASTKKKKCGRYFCLDHFCLAYELTDFHDSLWTDVVCRKQEIWIKHANGGSDFDFPPRGIDPQLQSGMLFLMNQKLASKLNVCVDGFVFFVQRLSHRSNKGLAASVSLARVFMTATMIIHTISVLEQRKIHSVRMHRSHFLWLSLPGSPRFSSRCPHRKSQAWTYPGNSGVNLLLSLFC